MKQKIYIFRGIYTHWAHINGEAAERCTSCIKAAVAWERRERSRWWRWNKRAFASLQRGRSRSHRWVRSNVRKFPANLAAFLVVNAFWLALFLLALGLSIAYVAPIIAAALTPLTLVVLIAPPLAFVSVLALVLAGVSTAVVYMTAMSMRAAEWVPLLLRGVSLTCPRCANRWQWPRYFCPECGQPHDDLWPGVHGIGHHKCDGAGCKASLPALLLLGRNDLRQECRKCHGFIRADLRASETHLAVVGARGSGKSNFLASGIAQLIKEVLTAEGFTAHIADPTQMAEFKQWRAAHASGRPVDETAQHRPPAFSILCANPAGRRICLYFYDASGEVFENQMLLSHENHSRHHRFVDGLFLILDPFAEAFNRNRFVLSQQEQRAIGPAEHSVDNVLDRLIEFLEGFHQVHAGATIKLPLAIVVTKGDARGILTECGGGADVKHAKTLPEAAALAEAKSAQVRQRLLAWGLSTVIELAERRFSQVKYFVCSPLGRSIGASSTAALTPQFSAAPFAWLLHAAGCRTTTPLAARISNCNRRFFHIFQPQGRRLHQIVIAVVTALLVIAAILVLNRQISHH
jgi:hypothetical protein